MALNIKENGQKTAVQWGKTVVKYKWLAMLVSIIILLGMSYGAKNMGFNSDYRVFFSEDNPQLNAFDALQEKYSKDDNFFIMLEPDDGIVFSNKTLSAIHELADESWQTPFSSRVDAITNFQYTRAVEDDLYVDDLVENPGNLTSEELAKMKEVAINEPLLINRLIDPDASVTALNITIKLPDGDPVAQDSAIAAVRKMLTDFEEKYPFITTSTSGNVPLSGAFAEASAKDFATLMPLMFLIIILAIGFATRSITGTLGTLMVIIFSVFTAIGFGGWIGIKLTAPSASVPIIVATLAIADSIHILITILQQMQAGFSKRDAIIESMRINLMPVFITSVTTVIGFLTLNFSDAPPFHDLGNLAAMGMMAAFFYSSITLPAFMAILPMRVKVRSGEDLAKKKPLDKLADYVIANRIKVSLISTVFAVILAIFSFKNELSDEFVKYFGPSITFRTDTDNIAEKLTGIYNSEFSIGSGEEGGINNPEYLIKLEEFRTWLYEQPEVIHVNTFSEVAKRINKSMHGDSSQYYRVPGNREEAAQYLLLYEMSLPFGLDLNNQVNVDKSETRFTVSLKNLSSPQLLNFNNRAETWLAKNAPEAMSAYATGPNTMFAHLGGRQMNSMVKGTFFAILLISIVLMFALKSFSHGALGLIPNVLPILTGFGVWALIYGTVNTGISVAFSMTLGIIVDDTVHFVSKYLRARREQNKSPEDAIRYAFATVGRALVITTIVLMAGFFILAQSGFALNNGMAKITVLIIGLALAIDFTLLPGILIYYGNYVDRKKTKKA